MKKYLLIADCYNFYLIESTIFPNILCLKIILSMIKKT